MNTQLISTPLILKHAKVLRNRVVVPPMASETADAGGFVTPETLAHYTRLSQSQAALVIVEYSFVHRSGRSEAQQLGISEDAHVDGLTKLATLIHQSGALSAIQLTHAGGKTERQYSDNVLLSPSGVIVPVKDQTLEASKSMDEDDLTQWKQAFLAAARRAERAGFDMIELHAAHGYGLNQWLSPLTNHRTDNYGGSLKNNLRLLLEIIGSIRVACPKLLLSVRIPGQDFLDGGLSQEDASFIATELESAGVDLLNVSSGIGGWRRPRSRTGEGYLVDEASFISSRVSTPVIGVGGIESSAFINDILRTKKVALAAVGRAILKDPLTWGNLQLKGLSL